MRMTSQERQRKWKVKQAVEGKKSVTVMLDIGIKDLIDKERKRTGETIAGVIERAVSTILNSAPADSTYEDDYVSSNSMVTGVIRALFIWFRVDLFCCRQPV